MFGMCSPWLRKDARPDDPDLGRMDRGTPEPPQKTRPMATRSLAARAASLELAFESFAIADG
jgi:hypothetical protein